MASVHEAGHEVSHEVSIERSAGGRRARCSCGWTAAVRTDPDRAREEARDHALLHAAAAPGDLDALLGRDDRDR